MSTAAVVDTNPLPEQILEEVDEDDDLERLPNIKLLEYITFILTMRIFITLTQILIISPFSHSYTYNMYASIYLSRVVPMTPIIPTERMVPSTSMGLVEQTYEYYDEWVEEETRGMLLEEEEEEQQLNEDSEESPVVRK